MRASLAIGAITAALILSACSPYIDPNVPEPIRPRKEPVYGTVYEVYAPSQYDRRLRWPLLVVCHTKTGDSPNRQIRDWTQLAEQHGFILAAPALTGVSDVFHPNDEVRLERLRADESHILAVVRHIQAAYNVSPDRVMIHGYKGGAAPTLLTAMRNPDVFRIASFTEPRLTEAELSALDRQACASQHFLVLESAADKLFERNDETCFEWLSSRGARITRGRIITDGREENVRVVRFIEKSLRASPWIRIAAKPEGDVPGQFRFMLLHAGDPRRVRWTFPGGDTSNVAEPIFRFEGDQEQIVRVEVEDAIGQSHERWISISPVTGSLAPPMSQPSDDDAE